jgi:hypothetical protein
MPKLPLLKVGFFVLLGLVMLGAKCPTIPTIEEVDVVIVLEDYIEFFFHSDGSINAHSDVETINIDDLRDDLDDAGISVADVDTITVKSVLYGVTAYNEGPTDRQIVNGDCTVTRLDDNSSRVIFDGATSMVYPLLNLLEPAPIEAGGIDFINDLMIDVLAVLKGESTSVSEFEVQASVSGNSIPADRYTDFNWRVRIYYQISGVMTVDVPDI